MLGSRAHPAHRCLVLRSLPRRAALSQGSRARAASPYLLSPNRVCVKRRQCRNHPRDLQNHSSRHHSLTAEHGPLRCADHELDVVFEQVTECGIASEAQPGQLG